MIFISSAIDLATIRTNLDEIRDHSVFTKPEIDPAVMKHLHARDSRLRANFSGERPGLERLRELGDRPTYQVFESVDMLLAALVTRRYSEREQLREEWLNELGAAWTSPEDTVRRVEVLAVGEMPIRKPAASEAQLPNALVLKKVVNYDSRPRL